MAKVHPDWAFTNLGQHLDEALLQAAYERVRKDGAAGVDGVTHAEWRENLGPNLRRLVTAAKSGTYRAPPVLRAWIPKGDGPERRPIGVPTFEDKVLQRGAAMLLEAVYEQDFLDCSYGFRPRRDAHQALKRIWGEANRGGGCWIVEADIRGFFDTLDHRWLREILAKRVQDGVLTRLIGKWLNAGVMEGAELTRPDRGTPQGGVISPLLANVYLHEVLDVWFERDVRPHFRGRCELIRYADDFVMTFDRREDAEKLLKVLPQRFAKFGLTLHPEKTKLIDFRSPCRRGDHDSKLEPRTFDFLGFTHCWSPARSGWFVVRQRTAKSRFTRALKKIATWCLGHRHDPLKTQQQMINLKLDGHYQYFGVTGNLSRIAAFHRMVQRVWHAALQRRDQRGRLPWEKMRAILARFPLRPPRLPRSVFPQAAKP